MCSYFLSDSLLAAVSALIDVDEVFGEAAATEHFVAALVALALAPHAQLLVALPLFQLLHSLLQLLLFAFLLVKLVQVHLSFNDILYLKDHRGSICHVDITFLLTASILEIKSSSSSSV